jgi:hypothetical protein
MEPKVTIQVRVPQRIRDALEFEAGNVDMTLSEFVRYVLRDYLKHNPSEEET